MLNTIIFSIYLFIIVLVGRFLIEIQKELFQKIIISILYIILVVTLTTGIFSIILNKPFLDYLIFKFNLFNIFVVFYLYILGVITYYLIDILEVKNKILIFSVVYTFLIILNCYIYPNYVLKTLMDLLF